MEKFKKIPISLLILLNMVSVVYSQNDSTRSILTNEGFSINYIVGINNVYTEAVEINDIKKLSFTDSSVKVTAEDSFEEININKINEISFSSGNKGWLGAGIGAGLGFLFGAITMAVNADEIYDGNNQTGEAIGGVAAFGVLSSIPGFLIGGIIGALIPEKDSLKLSTVKGNKKEKLMKFLKRNNK